MEAVRVSVEICSIWRICSKTDVVARDVKGGSYASPVVVCDAKIGAYTAVQIKEAKYRQSEYSRTFEGEFCMSTIDADKFACVVT